MKDEKVFIAAALYDPDGKLVQGDWGTSSSNSVPSWVIAGPSGLVQLHDCFAEKWFQNRILPGFS